MKKTILMGIILLFSSVTCAYSLPVLQLDADPGEWIGGEEQSTVSTSPDFTLFALLDYTKLDNWEDYQFFISVALAPAPDPDAVNYDYGSFDFAGETYNISSTDNDMDDYGTPPLEEIGQDIFPHNQDLQSHGIYDTWYKQFEVDFLTASLNPDNYVNAYNVQTGEDSTNRQLLQVAFDVHNGLIVDPYLSLHFDLYGYTTLNGIEQSILLGAVDIDPSSLIFAPYSKDVTSSVSEPATILMLGVGLTGLALVRRRRIKK